MSKKTKPKASERPTKDSTIERIILWMVSGLSGEDLEAAAVAKLQIDPSRVKAAVSEARKRLAELPADKCSEIICYCNISLRGYEAALVLEANGWANVKVMEGGLMAWPYPREK